MDKQKATILVNEKLSKEVVQKLNNTEINEFLDLRRGYIAQNEHQSLSNKAFVHNYTLLKQESKNRLPQFSIINQYKKCQKYVNFEAKKND